MTSGTKKVRSRSYVCVDFRSSKTGNPPTRLLVLKRLKLDGELGRETAIAIDRAVYDVEWGHIQKVLEGEELHMDGEILCLGRAVLGVVYESLYSRCGEDMILELGTGG